MYLCGPTPTLLAEVAREHVVGSDQAIFQQMLQEAINQLHEGSIARYRLRRSEFIAWEAKKMPGPR